MAFHEDPLLVHWAIGYLHDTEFSRPDPRKFVEETFLSPSAVRYYFDTCEPHDLNVLIGLVPDRVLAEHADRLIEMWPTLPYRAAIDAAAFLTRHDGVRAASLFEDFLSTPDTVRPRQVVGILQSLEHLAPEAIRRIIDLAQSVIETLTDTDDAYSANVAPTAKPQCRPSSTAFLLQRRSSWPHDLDQTLRYDRTNYSMSDQVLAITSGQHFTRRLHTPARSQSGTVRMHRNLLQQAQATFRGRLPDAGAAHAAMRNCVSCIWRGKSDHEHASSMASSVLFQLAPVCRMLGGIPSPHGVRSWNSEGCG
jgi:hypothetical protein